MAKGSQLTQLKSALSNASLTNQPQSSKKRKRSIGSQKNDRQTKVAKLQEIHEHLNPFDVQVTKLKHDVGGRKIRGTTGRPAESKQTGLEQRKRTLLKEYEDKNRVGGVVDRRFGENDPTMNPEERMLERFTKERQQASRGAAFNLDDEDELTHYGQSLSKLDDFDNSGLWLNEEDEEDGAGHIDARVVKSVHFGGFKEDDEDEDKSERPKSKAEVMAEVIAKSKEHKAMRQMSRQQDDDLRLQLDNELDSIRGLLFTETPDTLLPLEAATLRTKASDEPLLESVTTAGPSKVPKATASKRDDTFDQYVRELAFDQRAKPKDRTKTEEELALEEKARLEKAERRRVRRMEGAEDYDSEDDAAYNAKGPQQPAGDDLDDGFMPDDTLGALGNGLSEHPPIGSHDDGVVTDEDEEDEEDTDEDEDASGSENDGLHGSEDEDKENMDDEDRDSTASEQQALVAVKRKPARAAPSHRELPYTFECPESHEAFLEIVENIKDSDIPTVIQRIRALHHPSLAEDNKRKLVAFTGVLIDHILYVASPPSSRFNVVSHIIPHLVALTRSYSASSASHFISKLNLMEKNLKRGLSQNALEPDAKTFPGLAELALLRTVGVMWSTSDLTHAVVSPARLLMSSYLGLSRVRTMQDLASGLFLCTLWLQYESLSARFVPEAINFVVNTILHLAPHGFQKAADVPGSFPHPDLNSELCKPLRLSGPKAADDALTSSADLIGILTGSVEIHLAKSQLLLVSLRIMGRFAELYRPMDGYPELFQPILDIITGIKVRKLPESIQKQVVHLQDAMSRLVKFALQSRQPLMLQAHRPIPIPSYVPKFETSKSSYFKTQDVDREKNEAAKLRRQYKDEKKGAIRELRKDARFLAGVQQEQQRAKDDAYASRMKRVFGSIEGERAEEKQMEKEKARDKKRAGKR